MSETVWYRGKLTEIIPTEETVEQMAEKLFKERYGKDKPSYHETYTEALADEFYEEYYSYEGKLYSLTKESVEYDEDIIRAKRNEDGTIDYELKYYNGGAGFSECMDEALGEIKTDRKDHYKKPMRFGAQTLYESNILSNISLKQWEAFYKKSKSGEGLKVGDFIDTSVNTTAIQMVEFLDKFSNFETIQEVKDECEKYIGEIQKEVKLEQ